MFMDKILLENCCEILDSKRIPITASERKAGPYPYYGANGVQDYVDDYIFDDDLVLLAEDGGNFGSKEKPIAYRVSGKCWVNNHAHVLKPKAEVNVDYLCYSLMFYNTDGLVNGATRQKLTQATMRKMLIPQKSEEEQLQIVKLLNNVVDIIDKRKQQLQQLDELVKARFVEMFANKGYPQVEVGKLLIQNTTVEKIQNTKMEKFVTIGVRGSGARQRAIKDGKWPVPFSGYRVKSGQFIYSRIDARNGAFAILSDDLHDAVVSKDFPVFNIDTKQILPNVFLHSVLEDRFVKQIQNNSFGATNRQRIQEEVFAKYTISLAPLDVQKEYEAFCNQIDKSKLIFWKSLANLHTERHGCLYIFNIVSNSTYKM